MDYEKINKAMMEVLEEKYNIKIEAKVERRDKDEWTNEKVLLSR